MKESPYSEKFYDSQIENSLDSAEVVVPMIIKMVKPKSIVDFGCGIGTWLSVFRKNGIKNIQGIDGSWVKKNQLLIPQENFIAADLRKPVKIDRKFDLALSLEVAEHIPKECAEIFVDSLAKLSDIVIFSAAIPFQGGVSHVNEQWQDYWAEKFEKRGYVTIDCIRHRVWNNKKVSFFYAQNTLLFAKKSVLKRNGILRKEFAETKRNQLSIVHPDRYLLIGRERNLISKMFPSPLKKLRLMFLRSKK